jgi:acyl-CoA reductase-like NAD-dependent aldehyde dehydrogenase
MGLKYYFTDRPCKRGHLSEKYVSSSNCVACTSIRNQAPAAKRARKLYKERDYVRQKRREIASVYYHEKLKKDPLYKERRAEYIAIYYRKNRDKILRRSRDQAERIIRSFRAISRRDN